MNYSIGVGDMVTSQFVELLKRFRRSHIPVVLYIPCEEMSWYYSSRVSISQLANSSADSTIRTRVRVVVRERDLALAKLLMD